MAHPMVQVKPSRRQRDMSPVHPNAAAIDIGAKMHVAAVGPDRDPEPVRTFNTFTDDLHRLADWFEQCGVKTVVMESTGVYWIPIYEILEQRGFAVSLVNARDAKHVPGRKTDVSDAQWLQRLHEYGLLRSSFRPQGEIATLRAYLRQRERLLDNAAAHIQHMQKALTQMNLQLHHVVSDITGVTGMRIIRAIVNGERDPDVLASYRDRGCHASVETIRQALIGNDREEHIFALSQALELYDIYQAKVAECDKRIAAVLKRLKEASPTPADPLPAARHKGRSSNPLTFDVREALSCGDRDRPDADPRAGSLSGAEACRRMRNRPVGMAERQALHLLAWPGAAQQDLRREGSVLANAPFRQPGGVAVAAGGGDGRPHRHGAGRLLPPVVRARRQGQGRHRHGPQDRGALL